MLNKNTMKVNKVAVFSLIIFAVITIVRNVGRIPWFDEAHVWTIAEQLNFWDMVVSIKNEGHFFIWPAILYPFAKLHLYPWVMKSINWIFCFCSLIIMWRKAPIHNVIKMFITFSFPFLGCYGIFARCYSIGIFLLFSIMAIYENRLKYPKIYALLLILCANTSVMALIGATTLGLMFLKDLISEKNKDICTYLILFAGSILIILQMFTNSEFNYVTKMAPFLTSKSILTSTYIQNHFLLNTVLSAIFSVFIFKYFFKDKKSLFFLMFSYISILTLAFVFYGIYFWHGYFLYIYLIMAFWLANSTLETSKSGLQANIVLGIISFMLIFNFPIDVKTSEYYNSEAKKILSVIENDDILKNAKIIHNSGECYEALPYTNNKSYKIKNYCSAEDNLDYNLFRTRFSGCVKGDIFGQSQRYPEIIKQIADDNTFAYTKQSKTPVKNYAIIAAVGYNILIKKYKCEENYCFWKVEIK